jgi:hypothetical protein
MRWTKNRENGTLHQKTAYPSIVTLKHLSNGISKYEQIKVHTTVTGLTGVKEQVNIPAYPDWLQHYLKTTMQMRRL